MIHFHHITLNSNSNSHARTSQSLQDQHACQPSLANPVHSHAFDVDVFLEAMLPVKWTCVSVLLEGQFNLVVFFIQLHLKRLYST